MSQKTKKSLILLSLLFLGLLLPLHSTKAQLDFLGRLISNYMIANIIRFILAISGFVLSISSVFLNWVLSENFITYSYTDPAGNPIIQVGWTLLRDLTNMLFIVALVFIGLATALRLREYEFQKLLPKLIFIALLINFTPVICGVIVDASNIMMYFFISKLSGMELLRSQYATQTAIIQGVLKPWFDWESALSSVMQALAMAGANIISATVLFLFSLIFAVRYVVIWILVITSPIAFFSYIFPTTLPVVGGRWTEWWNMFLQWCFIGVTAAFFLYLGNHILIAAPTMITAPPPTAGVLHTPYSWAEFLAVIVPLGIGVGFLYFGYMQALSVATTMASYALSTAQRIGGLALGAGAAVAGKGGRKLGLWAKGKAAGSERVMKVAERFATTPTPGMGVPGVRGKLARWATSPIAAGVRGVGRAGLGVKEAGIKKIEAAEKEVEKLTADMIISKFRGTDDWNERIGHLNQLVKRGETDAMEKGLRKEEIQATIHKAALYDAQWDITNAVPHLLEPIMGAGTPTRPGIAARHGITLAQAYSQSIPNEPWSGFLAKISPARAGYISSQVLEKVAGATHALSGTPVYRHAEILESMVKTWTPDRVAAFVKTHKGAGIEALETRIKQLAATAAPAVYAADPDRAIRDWLKTDAPVLYRYVRRAPGFTI